MYQKSYNQQNLYYNNISISVKRSNLTLVVFQAGCYDNPGVERNFAGSSSYILRHILKVLKCIS